MAVGFLLIVVGLVLAGVTAWFWRTARQDDPLLGPLEVMGDKKFKDADEAARKQMLQQARTTVET